MKALELILAVIGALTVIMIVYEVLADARDSKDIQIEWEENFKRNAKR